MFDHIHLLILNSKLYLEAEEGSELQQGDLVHSRLWEVFQNLPDSVVAVFKGTLQSLPRLSVIDLNEDRVPAIQPPTQDSPVHFLYQSHYFTLWFNLAKHAEAETGENDELVRSSVSAPMMDGAAPCRQRKLDEMLDPAQHVIKRVEVKGDNQRR